MLVNLIKKSCLWGSIVLGIVVTTSTQASTSVWKVSKGNDHIFVGGTVHILPDSEFPLPKEFEQAYQQADSLVLETKLPNKDDAAMQAKMMKYMLYSDGEKVGDSLSEKTQRRLKNYVSSLGADLAMFERFKPGFLVTVFAMMEAQKAQLSGAGVDVFYSDKAVSDKKAIEYFETAEFQMAMIASMGEGDEERFIQSSLDQMNDFKQLFLDLLIAWRSGDAEQLNKLAIVPMKEDPNTLKALLTNRNKNWIPAIQAMFGDKDREFVLVGVAHLVGDDNLLALLEAKGYQIERL